jgi:hypothetical protein
MIDACRSVVTLNRMTREEAEKAGVDNPRRYFRVFSDKANMSPPAEVSDWYRLESVDLGNGSIGESDSVGVAVSWRWPDPMKDVTVADLRAAQNEVSKGGPWRENMQARDWVGIPIAKALRLDPDNKKVCEIIKAALKQWTDNKMFKEVSGKDKDYKDRTFIEVDQWASE